MSNFRLSPTSFYILYEFTYVQFINRGLKWVILIIFQDKILLAIASAGDHYAGGLGIIL